MEQELHLSFIDGLRACCALYIVFHHIGTAFGFPAYGSILLGWGGYCVTLFLVISGFCLMLPVVRNRGRLRDGAAQFYKRRARRILPPYYAALVLSVATASVLSGVSIWRLPDFQNAVVLHTLLVHNLSSRYEFMLNGPLWSIAVECQVYLAFPLLLVLWRKMGPLSATLIALVVGAVVARCLGYQGHLHYCGVFALGALAADMAWSSRWNYKVLVTSGAVSILLFDLANRFNFVLADYCLAAFAACFMAALAMGFAKPISLYLSKRWLTWLGGFAYSIYLLHGLVLQFATRYLWKIVAAPGDPTTRYLVTSALILPLTMLAAYTFYRLVEQPFLSRASKNALVKRTL